MYRIVPLVQGSDSWLSFRKGKIGSSSIATIMGMSPFETPMQLYYRILDDTQIEENASMRVGKELEPLARDLLNEERKANYQPVCMERVDYPWMIASLDAYDPDAPIRTAELKCPGEKTHQKAVNGEVPDYYLPQLQWQMFITGEKEMIYVSFDGFYNVEILVKRDEYFIEKMVACVKEFYNRLLNFDPPEATSKDYLHVDDAESLMLAADYKKTCDEIDALEKIKELQRLQLIERSGKQNAKIGPLKVTRVVSAGRTDYKGAAVASGIDLTPFKGKPSESWRIS